MAAQTITVETLAEVAEPRFVYKLRVPTDAAGARTGEAFAYLPQLRTMRQRAGMSQFQLAVRAGLGCVRTVSDLEHMHRAARFSTIHKLARALGTTAEALARFTTDADA